MSAPVRAGKSAGPAIGSRWTTRQRRNVYSVERIVGDTVHCSLSVQGLRPVTAELPRARFRPGRLDSLVLVTASSAAPTGPEAA